jgi:hypothetical protein
MCATCHDLPEASEELAQSISEWVKALRSGEYKQRDGSLVSVTAEGSSYCCLGVYGVLNGAEADAYTLGIGDKTYSSLLPEEMLPMAAQGFFATLNDTYRLTFEQIAEVVDATPNWWFASDDMWSVKWTEGFTAALDVLKGK